MPAMQRRPFIIGASAAAIVVAAAAAIFVCVSASCVDASVKALPQFAQNFASWATLASQRGQLRVIGSTVIRIASYRRNG